ncbi:MAG: FtsX-like permease family protein [Acidimicrobiales bacterium]
MANTNPSNLTVTLYGNFGNTGVNYSLSAASATHQIARLPGVKHVEASINLAAAPLRPDGAPRLGAITNIDMTASVNGLFFDQDRLAVIKGRMANPNRPDEIVMTAVAANLLGVHVGQPISFGLYTQHEEDLPGFGTPSVPPHRRISAKLVGVVQFNNAIVEDDIDRFPTFIVFTPALADEVLADSGRGAGGGVSYGLQLTHGNTGVASVEREYARLVPPGAAYEFHATAPISAKVDRTVKPLSIALGVFGGVAALAALLIAIQAISRQLRDADEDLTVLRALGAGPTTIAADSLIGIFGAILIGSLLATVVAVALSPLSPLGPVRSVFPGSPVAFDWTVLGFGLLVLIGGLGVIAVALSFREAPHRVARRSQRSAPAPSKALAAVASSPLPAPAVVGVRFALASGRGRNAVPVRSAVVGAVLAVALVVATLTFGSGLQSLVSHPALYGWDWSYMLDPSNTVPPQALASLEHDPYVAAWTGYDYNGFQIDGQNLPFLFEGIHPSNTQPVTPPILSGHSIEQKDQVVLGAATLAQLDKHIGDTVTVTYGNPQAAPLYVPPTRLVIVGTATLPAVGYSSVIADHTSMGTGVLASVNFLPSSIVQGGNTDPTLNGPDLVFVRLRNGVASAAGLASLQRIATASDRDLAAVPDGGGQGDTVSVVGVQRPAEIVNYRTMGSTPALLASALAGGAILALGLTLAASVRRRRHDLALLKTLGFTQRQLAAAIACQASVAAVIGIVIGVPLGIVLGRWLWTLFARQIYAVPQPTVPVLSVGLVAIGALVLANVVAALPGRSAGRTATAVLLRAE